MTAQLHAFGKVKHEGADVVQRPQRRPSLIEIGRGRWVDHRRRLRSMRPSEHVAVSRQEEWWLDSVLGLRLELERPNPSPKPSHADSLTPKSAARVVLGRSVNGKLTENENCAFIGDDSYAVNRTHGVGNNG
jgi:hypothetical protein